MKRSRNAVICGQNQFVQEVQQKIKATTNNVAETNVQALMELLLQKKDLLTLSSKGYIPRNQHYFFQQLPVVFSERNGDIPQLLDGDIFKN